MTQNLTYTLVAGASLNPSRYSNMAIRALVDMNFPVKAFGRKPGTVSGVEISTQQHDFTSSDIDTLTLYLSATNQAPLIDFLLALEPRRIIFNPGAENQELYLAATKKGIECMNACTLVMLNTGQF